MRICLLITKTSKCFYLFFLNRFFNHYYLFIFLENSISFFHFIFLLPSQFALSDMSLPHFVHRVLPKTNYYLKGVKWVVTFHEEKQKGFS